MPPRSTTSTSAWSELRTPRTMRARRRTALKNVSIYTVTGPPPSTMFRSMPRFGSRFSSYATSEADTPLPGTQSSTSPTAPLNAPPLSSGPSSNKQTYLYHPRPLATPGTLCPRIDLRANDGRIGLELGGAGLGLSSHLADWWLCSTNSGGSNSTDDKQAKNVLGMLYSRYQLAIRPSCTITLTALGILLNRSLFFHLGRSDTSASEARGYFLRIFVDPTHI